MRILIFTGLLSMLICVGSTTFAQKRSKIFGEITATSGEPIFLANIYFDKTEVGTYSDKNGWFSIDLQDENLLKNGLIFSAMGYEADTLYSIQNLDTIRISIKPKDYQLGEVQVIGKKYEKRYRFEKDFGFDSKKENNSYSTVTGKIICLYIENLEEKHGYIKEMRFRFSEVKNNPWIRIHVFNVRENSLEIISPGDEILKSEYVFQLKSKKSLTVNIERENIPIGEKGAFVGIELLGGGDYVSKNEGYNLNYPRIMFSTKSDKYLTWSSYMGNNWHLLKIISHKENKPLNAKFGVTVMY